MQESIENLTQRKQTVADQLKAFQKDKIEQVSRKNKLEETIRKVNNARVQLIRQLEELQSKAEPEVQNVQFLVGVTRIFKKSNDINSMLF